MKPFDWKYVPEKGLVLLTVAEVIQDTEVSIADFRDTHALAFKKNGGFIGWSRHGAGGDGAMQLGKLPLHLVNGIWYMNEDFEAQEQYANVQLEISMLELKLIP